LAGRCEAGKKKGRKVTDLEILREGCPLDAKTFPLMMYAEIRVLQVT
jgi:hypothetical protein